MVTPALPVGVYSIHSSDEKNVYLLCRICNIYAMHITYFWGEVYTLGKRDVIGTLHFSRPYHITIMTLLAPNYDINMTSFPCHMLDWAVWSHYSHYYALINRGT